MLRDVNVKRIKDKQDDIRRRKFKERKKNVISNFYMVFLLEDVIRMSV